MSGFTYRLHGILIGTVLLLAACDSDKESKLASPAPAGVAPAILKIYNSTCSNCHGKPGTGAPQALDTKAWAPRMAQGKEIVVNHIINGYQGMPPMGMCMQCSEDDFSALTEYMSGAKLH